MACALQATRRRPLSTGPVVGDPVEADGRVTGRAKMVRAEFVEKVKQSEHWQHQKMIPNLLAEGADIWA